MPRWCPVCECKLESDELVKGYEMAKGQFVQIEQAEIDDLKLESERIMEIAACVSTSAVDPILLAESFFLTPDPAGVKPYALLTQTLADTGRVAIAKLTKNGREHVVVLRPKDGGLVAHFIYYRDEIRSAEWDGRPVELKPAELKLARQLVESMAAPFDLDQYSDAYAERLSALIESKIAGKPLAATAPPPPRPPVGDMMGALEASLKVRRLPSEQAKPAKKGKGKAA